MWQDIRKLHTQEAGLQKDNQVLQLMASNAKRLEDILVQENAGWKGKLEVSQEKLAKLSADLAELENKIQGLTSRGDALRAENTALGEDKVKINAKITLFSGDNEHMRQRLGSIRELKKAIRELKIRMRQMKIELLRKTDLEKLALGNRGFIIRAGKTTNSARIRIEVSPAQ